MFQLVTKTPGNLNELWAQAVTGQVIELGSFDNYTGGGWIFNPATNLPILRSAGDQLTRVETNGEVTNLGCHDHYWASILSDTERLVIQKVGGKLFIIEVDGQERAIQGDSKDYRLDRNGEIFLRFEQKFFRLDEKDEQILLGEHQFQDQDSWGIDDEKNLVIMRNKGYLDRHEFFRVINGQEHSLGEHSYQGLWFRPDGKIIIRRRSADSEKTELLWFGDGGQEHSLGEHLCDSVKANRHRIIIRRQNEFIIIGGDGYEYSLGKHAIELDQWGFGNLGILIEQPNHSFILVVIK